MPPLNSAGLKDRFARWTRGQDGKEDSMSDNTTLTPEQEAAQAVENAAIDNDATGHLELEQLRGERDQLAAQLLQAQDRLARLQAEFDNARKREVKERQDARDYTVQQTIEPFLSVMDNFALALNSKGDAAQLRTGVELILKQMDDALRNLNVQAVPTVGEPFDPHMHEALGSIETLEHPDHSVLEEIRRGYKLRDKLLRPALVRIAVNPAQKSE
jgi:molecular chaperone GrpE